MQLNDTDRSELSRGFDSGNYDAAYETETFTSPTGETGFYRIGYLIGFFSSCELHEIPYEWRYCVERYRLWWDTVVESNKVVCAWCWGLIRLGIEPVSHGICADCERRIMVELRDETT